MSPLERWKNHFSLEDTFVPISPDELQLICCDSTFRTISHIGIEIFNCIFNSHDLQLLRRIFPADQGTKVQVKYNAELLNSIWVKNPFTKEYLQVINTDPITSDMNTVQTAKLAELTRRTLNTGALLTRAKARENLIALAAPLLRAKTQMERRRAFKILGFLEEGALEALSAPPKNKATAQRNSKGKLDTLAEAADIPINHPLSRPYQNLEQAAREEEPPPIFAVVKRETSSPL